MTSPLVRKINSFIKARQPWQLALHGLVLLGLVAILDHVTPPEISLSIFYLFPIMFVAWYVGKRAGYSMCAIAAFAMIFVDYTSGQWSIHQQWISFWNAGVRSGVFTLVVTLIVNLKASLRLEQTLARMDTLTGVRSSFAFKEELKMFVKSSVRHKQTLTLGYIDLDGFKSVNDTMGHAAGDLVLKAVGTALSDSVRGSDLVGRLGGDEFAVLLPNTGISSAKIFFDRLHGQLLEKMKIGDWPVGFSIGVAVFPEGPPDGIDILSCADTLMYRVKNKGKNSVIYEEFTRAETDVQQDASVDANKRRG